MRLTFINGSPRGKRSNTGRLMEHFIRGFLETDGNVCDLQYLVEYRNNLQGLADIFTASSHVIIGFPLYVDCMPGSVKAFLEALAPHGETRWKPYLGFVIQCGFPETYQIRFAEKYCEKLSRRIGSPYLGSILKGGCEGLDIQPSFLTDKYYHYFHALGMDFGRTGVFDRELLEKLARPEHLTAENMAQIIPFINQGLWDAQLEANGALAKSFDQPLL